MTEQQIKVTRDIITDRRRDSGRTLTNAELAEHFVSLELLALITLSQALDEIERLRKLEARVRAIAADAEHSPTWALEALRAIDE